MRWFVLGTLAALVCLLAAERRGFRPGVHAAKLLASTGFVGAALAAGALGSSYGRWILLALALSWLGDVLLLSRGTRPLFRLGLLSFLLAHLGYVAAFVTRGVRLETSALALLLVLPSAWLAWRWLHPHVPAALGTAVRAYLLVISAMVLAAAGNVDSGQGARIALGALLFYFSDLAVARERFVASTFWNRAWGLPLYYAAQLVLASTVR